ncbi:Tubulin polyglutamylase complex subunit 2 like protein [Aduncisulcus paluster]|uniref:Tubulin polyglutamylase complex subunit 2 like protein n=1 Tax=Aduncisulcus paluster TaxID=2918883 RepID=A0ABQ5KWN9_9EUKA|nr:Tubulin polyglutamylase complex subunit 2 like protein [Aduncisulcus paluster]
MSNGVDIQWSGKGERFQHKTHSGQIHINPLEEIKPIFPFSSHSERSDSSIIAPCNLSFDDSESIRKRKEKEDSEEKRPLKSDTESELIQSSSSSRSNSQKKSRSSSSSKKRSSSTEKRKPLISGASTPSSSASSRPTTALSALPLDDSSLFLSYSDVKSNAERYGCFCIDDKCSCGRMALLYVKKSLQHEQHSLLSLHSTTLPPLTAHTSDKHHTQPQVWFQDLSNDWHFIARSFSDYVRLFSLNFGTMFWQCEYTKFKAPLITKEWILALTPSGTDKALLLQLRHERPSTSQVSGPRQLSTPRGVDESEVKKEVIRASTAIGGKRRQKFGK